MRYSRPEELKKHNGTHQILFQFSSFPLSIYTLLEFNMMLMLMMM